MSTLLKLDAMQNILLLWSLQAEPWSKGWNSKEYIVYGLFTDTATSGRACNQVTKNITCTMQGKLSKYIQLHFYILKNTQRTCMKR